MEIQKYKLSILIILVPKKKIYPDAVDNISLVIFIL